MTLGKTTFDLTKQDYSKVLGKIINNHRANSRLIGNPRDFVLRSCRLSERWSKLANDPEVLVYLRNIEIARGNKVKMICLELPGKRQPVPKAKLVDELYPPRKIKTTASPEEKHHNFVKAAMRNGISDQLKSFRANVNLPVWCPLTGKKLIPGSRTDVDHCGMSFAEIADSFLGSKGLSYTDIVLVGPPTAKKFKDEVLWEEWKSFHNQKASYHLVCASANRSKGSSGYETPRELYGSFAKSDPEDLALDF